MDPWIPLAYAVLVLAALGAGVGLGLRIGAGERAVLEQQLAAARLESRTRRELAGDAAEAGQVLSDVAREVADAGAAPGGPAAELGGLLSAGRDRGAPAAPPGGASGPHGGAAAAPGGVGARGRA